MVSAAGARFYFDSRFLVRGLDILDLSPGDPVVFRPDTDPSLIRLRAFDVDRVSRPRRVWLTL